MFGFTGAYRRVGLMFIISATCYGPDEGILLFFLGVSGQDSRLITAEWARMEDKGDGHRKSLKAGAGDKTCLLSWKRIFEPV